MSVTTGGEGVKSQRESEKPGPIVIDLGKHRRKQIKKLRRGEGKLLGEAMDSIEELQRVGTIPQSAQPVILIVREKPESNKMLPMLCR